MSHAGAPIAPSQNERLMVSRRSGLHVRDTHWNNCHPGSNSDFHVSLLFTVLHWLSIVVSNSSPRK